MIDEFVELAGDQLRMIGGESGIDAGGGRYAVVDQYASGVLDVAFARPLGEVLIDAILGRAPTFDRRQRGVARPWRIIEGAPQGLPLVVRLDGDRQPILPAGAGVKTLRRGIRRMVAVPLEHGSVRRVLERDLDRGAQGPFDHRDLEVMTAPGDVTFGEADDQGECCMHSGVGVAGPALYTG